jgi:hypothetical protein
MLLRKYPVVVENDERKKTSSDVEMKIYISSS